MSASEQRVLVVIPTYNERAALPGTLRRLRTSVPAAHVLIADDASPDGTGQWADGATARTVDHRARRVPLSPLWRAAV